MFLISIYQASDEYFCPKFSYLNVHAFQLLYSVTFHSCFNFTVTVKNFLKTRLIVYTQIYNAYTMV